MNEIKDMRLSEFFDTCKKYIEILYVKKGVKVDDIHIMVSSSDPGDGFISYYGEFYTEKLRHLYFKARREREDLIRLKIYNKPAKTMEEHLIYMENRGDS